MKQAFLQKKPFILNSLVKVITDEDYQHAQTVWKEFNTESMKDYRSLYNLSDILLLADVFVNFSNICTNQYGLDPAWYYSEPGLASDAALKII